MADYKKRVQSADAHLSDSTTAQNVHIDGGKAQVVVVPANTGCRLLRISNNAKGLSLVVRTGSRVVASLATTTVENTYIYGTYCENGLIVDVGGTGSVTLMFS